ncbi:MAG: CHAT domain-containing protein [Oculatellaceae cyanobacterium Prado106]|nr:CHAT domain-containing protein [Oculatellaceae cyanobacterium Prado106]
MTVLMLSANPTGTAPLRLDEERREIELGLERSQWRERFKLVKKDAIRPRDFQRAMLDLNPQIVHFSGHGEGEAGIAFEDDLGQVKLVHAEALAGIFKLFADQVQCVILNACYSEVQAEAIARHVPYVIGMSGAIGDRAAIEFAVGFYDALGAGRDIAFAHALGCRSIQLAGISEDLTPVLKKADSVSTPSPAHTFTENLIQPIPAGSRSLTKQLKSQFVEKPEISRQQSYDLRFRRLTFVGLTVILFVAGITISLSSNNFQDLSRFRRNQCSSETTKEKKLGVIVAQIYQGEAISGSRLPSLQNQIFDALSKSIESDVNVCLAKTQVSNVDEAKRLGQQQGASIVVWGRMDALAIELKVTTVVRSVEHLTTLPPISQLDLQNPKQTPDILRALSIMTAFALSEIYQFDHQSHLEARRVLEDTLDLLEPPNPDDQSKDAFTEIWAKAYYFLGLLYYPPDEDCTAHQQDCMNAISAFDKGTKMNPKPYASFIEQGLLLGQMKQWDEAVNVYSKLIKLDPESEEAINARANRAAIFVEQKKFQQADADLQIVCRYKTNIFYWRWLSLRGKLELLTGKTDRARETFQEIKTNLKTDEGGYTKALAEVQAELHRLSQEEPSLKVSVQRIQDDLREQED